MSNFNKNNRYNGGFERFTKRRLTERDAERQASKQQHRNGRPKRTNDDFFSSYEVDESLTADSGVTKMEE